MSSESNSKSSRSITNKSDWHYNRTDSDKISEIIGKADAVREVERGVNAFLLMFDGNFSPIVPKELKKELRNLEKAADAMINALELSEAAQAEMRRFVAGRNEDPGMEKVAEELREPFQSPMMLINEFQPKLQNIRAWTNATRLTYKPRGRPRDWPISTLLWTLAGLWTKYTGQPPKRKIDTSTGKVYGPFYDLVSAVFEPLVRSGLAPRIPSDKLIKKAIKMIG